MLARGGVIVNLAQLFLNRGDLRINVFRKERAMPGEISSRSAVLARNRKA